MLQYRKTKIENAKIEVLTKAISWLKSYTPLVNKYYEVYKLVEPAVWKNYKMLGFKQTYEQGEMDKITMVLKYEWKKRPNVLRLSDIKKVKTNGKTRS